MKGAWMLYVAIGVLIAMFAVLICCAIANAKMEREIERKEMEHRRRIEEIKRREDEQGETIRYSMDLVSQESK